MGIFEVLNESGLTDAQKNAFFGNGEVVLSLPPPDSTGRVRPPWRNLSGQLRQVERFLRRLILPEMIATAHDLMVEYVDNGSVANGTIVVEVDVVDGTNVDQFKGFK